MGALKVGVVAFLVGGVALGLAGCREEEQDRAMHFEKGVYSGKQDTELTEDQRRALEQRGRLQKF